MATSRDTILDATLEAERLHKRLKTKERLGEISGLVDIFASIVDQEVALIFKPLDGLLGAYLQAPSPGIIVTTVRPLSIQRFTAAHELGHWYLKHLASFDDDAILHRSPYVDSDYDQKELAADTFAATFLMPEWLVNFHAERQGWNYQDLSEPIPAYQLSLRLGVSYEACVRVLRRNGLIDQTSLGRLLAVQPKAIKQRILSDHDLPNWYPNVWVLTERDAGTKISGEPNDAFVVKLKENSGAGYLWNLEQVRDAGFIIVDDERKAPDSDKVLGGAVSRILTARSKEPCIGQIAAAESRPWAPADTIMEWSFKYDFRGKEHGLPRAVTEQFALA